MFSQCIEFCGSVQGHGKLEPISSRGGCIPWAGNYRYYQPLLNVKSLMLCSPCRQSNGFGTLWNLEMRCKATNAFVLHLICIAWYFMYHKCFKNMATSSNFLARVSKLTCTCYTNQRLANYLNLFYRCGEEQWWFQASLFFKQPPWCSSWNHQKWRTLGDACKWNW